MARFYAQLCALVFLLVAAVGWFLGDASHVDTAGQAQGNLGGVALHMTYVRDALDTALLVIFVWVGFVASRHAGRLAMFAVGGLLLILGIAGFVIGDTDAGTRSVAGLHFTTAMNIFDTAVGILGILAALGTIEEDAPTSIIRG
jgi:hypothetical protein